VRRFFAACTPRLTLIGRLPYFKPSMRLAVIVTVAFADDS
jgi:hypothetical protein